MRSSRLVEFCPDYVNSFLLISRNRNFPVMSSTRNGNYSGGGGPDRLYPNMRNSYMDARSRPYDSPYERQRMPPHHLPPMSYPDPYNRPGGDPYSVRSGGVDPYGRDEYYRHRAPPMPIVEPYGRGPPMRYVAIRAY